MTSRVSLLSISPASARPSDSPFASDQRTPIMTNRMHAVSAALVATMLVSGGRFAAAQSTQYTLDTRWRPWLGCWQPSEAPAAIGEKVTTVCVAPTNSASAVQVTILEDTVVTMRDTVDASG